MFAEIKSLLSSLDVDGIPLSRKRDLDKISNYIRTSLAEHDMAQLTFICTHNSRRSHLCQVWAQVAARFYDVENVRSYSGGTEVTAVFPKIIKTLKGQGLEITKKKKGENPKYYIAYSEIIPPMKGFSKLFNDPENPSSKFAAIMTCDHASENCPIVSGAEERISVTYLDPKVSDGTPEQQAVYNDRSLQIATEMKYVFSQVHSS